MALYDITLLQTSLTPVASGLTVSAYQNAPAGLSPTQISGFQTANVPAATAATDVNGHFQMTLAPSTLTLLVPPAANYQFTYITTGAQGQVTYALVYPPSNLCHVYGKVLGADNSPQAGVTVTANLNATGPAFTGDLILSLTDSTKTDANGDWALDLIPNDQIVSPKQTLYTFIFQMPAPAPQVQPFYAYSTTVQAHGASVSKVVEIPSVASVEFSTLI